MTQTKQDKKNFKAQSESTAKVDPNNLFAQVQLSIQSTIDTDVQQRYVSAVVVTTEPIAWMGEEIERAIERVSYRDINIGFNNGERDDELYIPKDNNGNDLDPVIRQGLVPITTISKAYVAMFEVALGARLVAVSNCMRLGFKPRDFEYLSVFGPILGMYGEYRDDTEGYEIVPVPGKDLYNRLVSYGCIRGERFVIPSWYADALRFFRTWRIFTNIGLPKEKVTSDASVFKLSVEGGKVVGKPGLSNAQVLMSALAHATRINELFGAYRTLYTGVTHLRGTFEDLALKTLHQLDAAIKQQ